MRKLLPAALFKLLLSHFSRFLILLLIPVLLTGFFNNPPQVQAATRTWDGGGSTNNWSECANWSSDTCPGSADIALFDGTSSKDAVVNASFSGTVSGVRVNAGYTGTISMGRTLTVTDDSFVQSAGNWTGGGNLVIERNLTLNGGTFNLTGNTITFSDSNSLDASTISCSGAGGEVLGTVVINKTSGGNLTLSSGCTITVSSLTATGSTNANSVITISGTMNHTGTTFTMDRGTLTVNTGATVTYTGTSLNIGRNLTLNGTFDLTGKTITFTDILSDVSSVVSCSGGTGTLQGATVVIAKDDGADFTLNSGCTITVSSLTATGSIGANSVITISGTMNHTGTTFTMDRGTLTVNTGATVTYTGTSLNIGRNLTLNGTFDLTGKTITFTDILSDVSSVVSCSGGTGTLQGATVVIAKDDGADFTLNSGCTITVSSLTATGSIGANSVITISGTMNHTGTTFTMDRGTLTVNTGATVTYTGTSLNIGRNLTLNGTFDLTGKTITFTDILSDVSSVVSCSGGTGTLQGATVVIAKDDGADFTLNSGCTITVSSLTATGSTGANSVITISGTMNHTGTTFTMDRGTLTVNTGATVTYTGTSLNIGRNLTLNGTFDLTGKTITFTDILSDVSSVVSCSGGTGTLQGATVVIAKDDGADFTLNSGCTITVSSLTATGSTGANSVITISGTMNHTGTTFTMDRGTLTVNTGATVTYTGTSLNIGRNLTLNGTFDLTGKTITFTDILSDGDSNVICGSSVVIQGNVTINKDDDGDWTLASNCTILGNFTRTDGVVTNPSAARTLTVHGNFSMSTSDAFGGANLTLTLAGGNNQNVTRNAGTMSGIFRVAKSGGVASLTTTFITGNTCTIVSGSTFNLNGQNFTCGSTFTVEDGGILELFGSESVTTPTLASGSLVRYTGDGDSAKDVYWLKNWTYHHLEEAMVDAVDILRDGLHLRWSMDDSAGSTVTDNSGNGLDGTATGTSIVAGNFGNARDLNGSSDYISLSSPILPTRDFTYSAWVHLDANNDESIFMAPNSSGGNEFLVIVNSSNRVDVYVDTVLTVTSNATIPTGSWRHVAVTRSGSTVSIYINGAFDNSGSSSAILDFGTCPLYIGLDVDSGCSGSLGNYLDGRVDEARVYNRGLSASEVSSLYNSPTSSISETANINGNLTLSSGVLTAPTTINIAGNFTKSGGTFNHNSGTVVFNGTSGTSTLTTGGSSLNNLTLNDGGGSLTVELQDNLTLVGNLTITGGTLDVNSVGNYSINISGNWANSDTFLARSGMVTFGSGNQSISGSTTFFGFSKPSNSTLTFEAGSTTIVEGTWSLHGTDSSNRLLLRSSSPGNQWYIDPQGTRDISFLDVQDSNNINASTIAAIGTGSVSAGNNFNWSFDDPDAPSFLGPANRVDGSYTSDNAPNLTFTLSDTEAGQLRFQIQISTTSDFASLVVDYTSDLQDPGPASFTVGQAEGAGTYTVGLEGQTLFDGNYYWRVKALDGGGGQSPWAVANAGDIAFRVDNTNPTVPGTPATTSPTSDTTPTWTWTASTDSGSGVASYTVQWSQSSSFSSGVSSTSVSTNSFTHSADLAVGTWYLRVQAVDNLGHTSSFSSNGIVVISSSPPPSPPPLPGKSGSAPGQEKKNQEPLPPTPTCPVNGNYYLTASGDKIRSISERLFGSRSRENEIINLNKDRYKNLNANKRLEAGLVLELPNGAADRGTRQFALGTFCPETIPDPLPTNDSPGLPGDVVIIIEDSYGDPIPGAEVIVDGESVGHTDESGQINLELEDGTHVIEVRYGDEVTETSIDVDEKNNSFTVIVDTAVFPPLIEIPIAGPTISRVVDYLFRDLPSQASLPRATVVTGVLLVSLVDLISSLPTIRDLPVLLSRTINALLIYFRRRRPKPWGVVYDSVTKLPLDPVAVTLFAARAKIEQRFTDLEGRYGFLVTETGKYQLTATKANYEFPSKIVSADTDYPYSNIYHGDDLEITNPDLVAVNIPMDPLKSDWNQLNKPYHSNPTLDRAVHRALNVLIYTGFAYSVFAVLHTFSVYNLLILSLYLLAAVIRLINPTNRKWGYLTEKKSGQALSYAVVKLFLASVGRQVAMTVADKLGRYYLLVPGGDYYLTVEKRQPTGDYQPVYRSEAFTVNREKGLVDEVIKV